MPHWDGGAQKNPDATGAATTGLGFHDHASAHFQMQGVAEMCAITPVHAWIASDERDRGSFLWIDNEIDVVVGNSEAVCQIFDFVQVGQNQSNFITFLNGEFTQAKCWCL